MDARDDGRRGVAAGEDDAVDDEDAVDEDDHEGRVDDAQEDGGLAMATVMKSVSSSAHLLKIHQKLNEIVAHHENH